MNKKTTIKPDLPEDYMPSADEMRRFLDSWNRKSNYSEPEKALDKLFRETYKENNCLEEVLIKCSALNNLYSTNIFDVYSMAKHICTLNIDEKLRRVDYSLVKDIATLRLNKKKVRVFYSFASKYCSHHLPNDYAIYDSYVERVLVSINKNKKTHFATFTKEGLKDYDTFMCVIQDFRYKFHLTQFSIRQLDHYLWQLGKTYFNEN